ncbi:MAG: rhomboid family intramembrane serine protease [Planctomycetota bacterium]
MTEPDLHQPGGSADADDRRRRDEMAGRATERDGAPASVPLREEGAPPPPGEAEMTEQEAQILDAWFFHQALRAEVPWPWVTVLLVIANAAVFGAMVASGVHPFQPETRQILEWGGLHGPSVVFKGERWRLLTANYIHIGLLHILFNMWCLSAAGRFAERLFGNLAFLLLYTLSGIGGSVASLWADPSVVGAGASGAVFGVFGALVGFVLVRRRALPLLVSKPLLISLLVFIGGNLYFGFMVEGIDNAAHVGGLVTGFAAGMLLSRRVPAPEQGMSKVRYAYAAGLAVAIGLAAAWVIAGIPERFGGAAGGDFAGAYAEFSEKAHPLLARSQKMSAYANQVARQLVHGRPPTPHTGHEVRGLAHQAARDAEAATELPADHPQVEALKNDAASALNQRARSFAALARWLETGRRQDHATFIAHRRAADEMMATYSVRRGLLLSRRGLRPERSTGN